MEPPNLHVRLAGGAALSVGPGGGGPKLQTLTVSWRRGLTVGLREGIGGGSADAKGSEAWQAAGRPRERDLGPLGRSHRGAFQPGLRQPRGDLHRSSGVQVWHEGRIHDSSCRHQIQVMEE